MWLGAAVDVDELASLIPRLQHVTSLRLSGSCVLV